MSNTLNSEQKCPSSNLARIIVFLVKTILTLTVFYPPKSAMELERNHEGIIKETLQNTRG